MKKFLNYFVIILLITLVSQQVKAQDFHLTQYDMAPLYINPALTGMYGAEKGKQGDFRIMANYRSQWQKLHSKPYSTTAFSFDIPMGRFGVGSYVMDNLAGRSNYNTLNFILSGSYCITSEKSKDHYLTTGVQLGFLNRKFGQDDLLFSSQYENGVGLDPSASNGEAFQKVSIFRFDSNFGIYYKYKNPFSNFNPYLGLSIYHLNTPNQAVTGISSKMPMRFNVNLGSDIYINKEISLRPSALYMYQGKAQEISATLLVYYHMRETYFDLIIGSSVRWRDSFSVQFGLKQGRSTYRISYDFVTSPLRAYAGTRGGIELGVIYTGFKRGSHANF